MQLHLYTNVQTDVTNIILKCFHGKHLKKMRQWSESRQPVKLNEILFYYALLTSRLDSSEVKNVQLTQACLLCKPRLRSECLVTPR